MLLKGVNGEAYNAANGDTYCSIREMADLVAEMCAVNVVIKESVESSRLYPKELFMNLSTEVLNRLGWKANIDLRKMFLRMMGTLNNV